MMITVRWLLLMLTKLKICIVAGTLSKTFVEFEKDHESVSGVRMMDWDSYTSMWSEAVRNNLTRGLERNAWYEAAENVLYSSGNVYQFLWLQAERSWDKVKKPFYNVWPCIGEALAKTSLAVPNKFLFKGAQLYVLFVGVVEDVVDKLKPCVRYGLCLKEKRFHRTPALTKMNYIILLLGGRELY